MLALEPRYPCREGNGAEHRSTVEPRRLAGKGRLAWTLARQVGDKVPGASRSVGIAAATRRQLLKASGSQRRMYRDGARSVPLRCVFEMVAGASRSGLFLVAAGVYSAF
jgi:hypothetical protein